MTGLSRDAILARYRHLRAISVRHHNGALEFLSRSALLEHARHLGLTEGKTLVAESMDELTLAFDLAIHTAKPGHSRAIDRYARAAPLQPGSDELGCVRQVPQIGGGHEAGGVVQAASRSWSFLCSRSSSMLR
jgi:hypothetical protein